jgi:uncharacterized membrane protein YeiB
MKRSISTRLLSRHLSFMCTSRAIAQLISSRLWLLHFRIGPAEWLWRRLSYGKRAGQDAG